MEILDFQGKRWLIKTKVDGRRVDNPSTLKEMYGCDMVIRNNQNIFFVLDEIIDAEFEDI